MNLLHSNFLLEIVRLSAWLGLLLLIFVPLEKWFGLKRRRTFPRPGFGADLFLYFLSSLTPRFVLVLPLSLAAAAAHHALPSALYSGVAALPVWLRLILGLLIGEVGAYWGHRWSHQIPLLWRFHAVHHGPEDLDWLVNTRAHPVDIIFTRLCGLIPIYLTGLAQPMTDSLDIVPLLVTVVGSIWGFFIHANLNWRFGWLEWVVSSPAFHHWHHTNDGPDVIDKNYASMLPVVDWWFGTIYLPGQNWPRQYGTHTTLGRGLSAQLLRPFLGAGGDAVRPQNDTEGSMG